MASVRGGSWRFVCVFGLLLLLTGQVSRADADAVERLVFPKVDLVGVRARGDRVLAELAELYERSDTAGRATIANIYYQLGWRSADARRVLMADLQTADTTLRLNVQWALGRVSDDLDVVDELVGVMRRDQNPLFRDKAACALAHDQIHLTERQKLHLYQRLIEALEDGEPQVRSIAIKALQIHVGNTRGFRAGAPLEDRRRAVEEWRRWLASYREAF
jgi:hypothetical protein